MLTADGAAETKHFAPAVTVTPPAPSNADVVACAEALAKAAGRKGKPSDFIAPAQVDGRTEEGRRFADLVHDLTAERPSDGRRVDRRFPGGAQGKTHDVRHAAPR
ncbi:hypothetical protein FF100_30800 [Methylobacterium terricola]|uniref:Uncharacterized protein n=1 Tax=Methylobacterium terricola TaxID=2583531 RepID=A0A5C4L8K1_9HYPH|nr:hypothetical protein [Methylobacterium terricola]TNC07989.1 hypothetical protein FF100_30800 [Methylobacterium terricola]